MRTLTRFLLAILLLTATASLSQAPRSGVVGGGVREPACGIQTFEDMSFTVCGYQTGRDDLGLAWKGDSGVLGSLPALKRAMGQRSARVLFAMNAGMYDPRQAPVGLFAQGGVVRRPAETAPGDGNFYLLPNGVFSADVDGAVHIEETRGFLARPWTAWSATQSGPLLVQDGRLHPALAPNGTSVAIRNGVGVQTPTKAYFVVSNTPVSLGRFARFMRDGLGCPDALYFDGAVSSLWAPNLGRLDDRTGLGPLVVVLSRPSAP